MEGPGDVYNNEKSTYDKPYRDASSTSGSSSHSRSNSFSSLSSATSHTFSNKGHKREGSYPPPYLTYTNYEDEAISPKSDTRDDPPDNPYISNIYSTPCARPPNYTMLPAFGSPRLYSERLHRLMETREQPLYLHLEDENDEQYNQDMQIVYLDEKSTYNDDPEDAELLPHMPCDHHDEEQAISYDYRSHKRRRCSSMGDSDREISWLTFAGIAAVLFLLVCSCSFFVAWTVGVFSENGGLRSHMQVSSNIAGGAANVKHVAQWKDDYRAVLNDDWLVGDGITISGAGIGAGVGRSGDEVVEMASSKQVEAPNRWTHARKAKEARRLRNPGVNMHS